MNWVTVGSVCGLPYLSSAQLLSVRPSGTNSNQTQIKNMVNLIQENAFEHIVCKKCRPFCFSLNVITPIAPLACNYTHLSQGNFAITLITLLSSAMTDVQCSYKACGNPTIGPAKARVEVRAARPTKLPAKCKVNWSRLVYST